MGCCCSQEDGDKRRGDRHHEPDTDNDRVRRSRTTARGNNQRDEGSNNDSRKGRSRERGGGRSNERDRDRQRDNSDSCKLREPDAIYYIAMWKYEAKSSAEVSVEKGDRLMEMDMDDETGHDWLFLSHVSQMGGTGYVPRNIMAKIGSVETEPWYFGHISHEIADLALKGAPDGTFLVRVQDNPGGKSNFVLVVQNSMKSPLHYIVKTNDRMDLFSIGSPKFKSVQELIAFYKSTKTDEKKEICHVLTKSPQRNEPTLPILPTESQKMWREIPRDQIQKGNDCVKGGTWGKVYRGTWSVKSTPPKPTEQVFVREIKTGSRLQMLSEAIVMKHLVAHPRLIKLLGVVSVGEPNWIITESVRDGTLKEYLQKRKSDKRWMDMKKLVALCTQIAEGMAYMESKKIVHGNLSADSIMVEVSDNSKQTVNVKIADFEFSVMPNSRLPAKSTGCLSKLPRKWMAPEVLTKGDFSVSSDVWSFAIVIFEVFNYAEEPYQGVSSDRIEDHVVKQKRCVDKGDVPDDIYAFTEQCLSHNPSARPSFQRCFNFFETYVIPSRKDYNKLKSPEPRSPAESGRRRKTKPRRNSSDSR